jgi:hypothetical protein
MGCALSGCGGTDEALTDSNPKSPGRYSGIGTYEAGRLWAQMAGVQASSDPAAAKLEDDDQIIVVVDSHTGEVRQCGNYSGFCVTNNPWAGQGPRNVAPVKLTKHAADLAAEDQAGIEEVPPAPDEATPVR